MAKQSGLGSKLWVGAYDLSGDIGAADTVETIRGVLPSTSIEDSAESRIMGLKDGNLGFNAYWNTATDRAHLVLTAITSADVQCTLAAGTPALGTAAASIIAKKTSMATARGSDGSLVASIAAAANGYGLEWGELLTTGAQTFASGTVNGSSIDLGAVDTAFGAAAYLHVLSLGSGTPTVVVADSANNSAFTTVTGLSFTPTAAGTERKETAALATVRQYVRITVSGTYTDLVCVLNFVRYTANPA
jgi:hypothetical protein